MGRKIRFVGINSKESLRIQKMSIGKGSTERTPFEKRTIRSMELYNKVVRKKEIANKRYTLKFKREVHHSKRKQQLIAEKIDF